jgi:hypothetical protein
MQATGSARGVSLVEAVVALAILAFAYIPLAQLFHITSAETVKSRNELVAQQLASNLFELYRVKGDTILGALTGTGTMTSPDVLAVPKVRELLTGAAKETDDVVRFSSMKMKVTIVREIDEKLGLDRIDATLEWQEDGRAKKRTYARLVGA